MLKQLIIILAIGLPSWFLSDMDSTSRVYAYVFPILTFACVLAFCLWLIEFFERIGTGKRHRTQ